LYASFFGTEKACLRILPAGQGGLTALRNPAAGGIPADSNSTVHCRHRLSGTAELGALPWPLAAVSG